MSDPTPGDNPQVLDYGRAASSSAPAAEAYSLILGLLNLPIMYVASQLDVQPPTKGWISLGMSLVGLAFAIFGFRRSPWNQICSVLGFLVNLIFLLLVCFLQFIVHMS
jgi:hypothetical protein